MRASRFRPPRAALIVYKARRSEPGTSPLIPLWRLFPLGLQLPRAALQEVVNQFRSRVVHLYYEAINLAGEVVEEPDRRHCHSQSQGRSKERFRNAACDRSYTSRLRSLHTTECVDDAEYRSEQSYERSGRAYGR